MHVDVDYSRYKTIEEQRTAALKDCKNYLGAIKYHVITEMLKDTPPEVTYEQLYNCLGFGGIHGYPAKVLIETFTKLRAPMITVRIDLTK
jgi:hypothetical protein